MLNLVMTLSFQITPRVLHVKFGYDPTAAYVNQKTVSINRGRIGWMDG
jgi:hypothetical protein